MIMAMTNDLQKGTFEYKNKKYIYEVIEASSKLVNILSQNMDEFPNQKYEDMYMLTQALINLKWSAVELLGRDVK